MSNDYDNLAFEINHFYEAWNAGVWGGESTRNFMINYKSKLNRDMLGDIEVEVNKTKDHVDISFYSYDWYFNKHEHKYKTTITIPYDIPNIKIALKKIVEIKRFYD